MTPHEPRSPQVVEELSDDIIYPNAIPFVLVHLACFAVFWTGVTLTAVLIGVLLYFVRMWALTGGYHRYFSHRSYKTSRIFQFILAFLGQTCAQRGGLWWAANHRHHHLHSDTPEDIHSPRHMGLFDAHVGWIFRPRRFEADYSLIPDLTRYPELVWLDRRSVIPAVLVGVLTFLVGGWPGLVVGFFMSTVLLYHCAFSINSLAHVVGTQRYMTGDDSRNNWWLALITLGEGWHNNHHYYQSATAQGWRWYEVDITYYVLRALSWTGLVWDLRDPPERVLKGEQPLGRKVVEQVAWQLATSFPVERIAEQARASWANKPSFEELMARAQATREAWGHAASEELHARARRARAELEERLRSLSLPHLPSLEELRQRAEEMFHGDSALEPVVERARELLQEAVGAALLQEALGSTA